MKKFFTFLLAISSVMAFCQTGGVSITPGGGSPDPSAALDVNFNNKGLLMPRLSQAQRDSIVSPAKGLFIYNTDCDVINYNAGTPASPNWATVNASNVLTAGVSIAVNPIGAVCAGTSVTFTATPNQNNLSPSYQWQLNGANVGTNSSTYTNSSLNNGDAVTCILTSTVPCITSSPATSNAITMLVNAVPTITGTSPASFCSEGAVTLAASASAGTVNWYADSTGGSSLLSGSYFTVSGLTSTTTYYVNASANGCTSPSRTAVTATSYPYTPQQPGSITGPTTVCSFVGGTIYSVTPVPYTTNYLWTVPVSAVINSGQSTDSISVTFGAVSGDITVVASNVCGTSQATTTSITVNQTPATNIYPSVSPAFVNGNIYFSSYPYATDNSYSWSFPGGSPSSSNSQYPVASWGSPGTYIVTLSASNGSGCPGNVSDTLTVINSLPAHGTQTFAYSGGAQTFTVPAGINSVTLAAYGAQGGSQYGNGALGGSATGTMAVTPGQALYVYVGGQNGFNGGGAGGGGCNGGGESDVRVGGNAYSNWVIVAGGGGGGSSNNSSSQINSTTGTGGGGVQCANGAGGGGGGYYTGYSYSSEGGAGTCTAGGTSGGSYGGWAGGGGGGGLTGGGDGGVTGGYGNAGSPGTQGQGGAYGYNSACGSSQSIGSGGGGGYYGGGGSASGQCAGGSGGGGSSWASASMTNTSFAGGVQGGNGQVVITW